MPRYVVHNSNVEYIGLPYNGPYMEIIGQPFKEAVYETSGEAIHVANELKSVVTDIETDWTVRNEFSEAIIYTTKQTTHS